MERGSDKHGPRLDDQLTHELDGLLKGESDEGRTDYRSKESPGEEEPGLGHRPEVDDPTFGPPEDELELRSEIARRLPPSVFPARAAELQTAAREEHAPPHVLALLDGLPDDLYETVQQVFKAVGGRAEER